MGQHEKLSPNCPKVGVLKITLLHFLVNRYLTVSQGYSHPSRNIFIRM